MIDVALVHRLVAAQFPEWATLEVTPVELDGWDNRTFRLGDEMSVRLPSQESYAVQVDKEHRWLPVLAGELPLPIPTPIARGVAAEDFPLPWSIYRWLDGEPVGVGRVDDLTQLAISLAEFLNALHRVDPARGPTPGAHNFHRGGPLTKYDGQTREAIDQLAGEIPTSRVVAVWEAALGALWPGPPVWFHGDVASGNLLVRDGRLSAVIDFGTSGVGDPACDTSIAWTLLTGEARQAFRATLAVDAGIWARGRGWTLWKALITMVGSRHSDSSLAAVARAVLDRVLADHDAGHVAGELNA
jgi:aminoglycoside phosphotransferase (APT) family kinase protein